jgi:hypothetical protein
MQITESELMSQYQQASSGWPFIQRTELAYGLPRMLLFAVGSRETNLTNEVGDFGHGHGVWQLDDRSHAPPGGIWDQFDANVPLQCATAAAMLHNILVMTGRNVEEAAAIYNSGQPGELGTTYDDYGIEVLERMQFLQRLVGGNPVQQDVPFPPVPLFPPGPPAPPGPPDPGPKLHPVPRKPPVSEGPPWPPGPPGCPS